MKKLILILSVITFLSVKYTTVSASISENCKASIEKVVSQAPIFTNDDDPKAIKDNGKDSITVTDTKKKSCCAQKPANCTTQNPKSCCAAKPACQAQKPACQTQKPCCSEKK